MQLVTVNGIVKSLEAQLKDIMEKKLKETVTHELIHQMSLLNLDKLKEDFNGFHDKMKTLDE